MKGYEYHIKGWSMACSCHTYISLYYDDKFIHCYDNNYFAENEEKDEYYMEHVIPQIELRTGMKITEIPIYGYRDDFNGLRFLHGGFKAGRDWLKEEQVFARKWIREEEVEYCATDCKAVVGALKGVKK